MVPETVQHITTGCKMHASKEYFERHNQLARIVYSNICNKYRLDVPGSNPIYGDWIWVTKIGAGALYCLPTALSKRDPPKDQILWTPYQMLKTLEVSWMIFETSLRNYKQSSSLQIKSPGKNTCSLSPECLRIYFCVFFVCLVFCCLPLVTFTREKLLNI